MALSDDQRALLRLLARREDGYEDIAALKGMSVADVRAEVKAALDELESETVPDTAAASPAEDPAPKPSPPAPKPPAPPAAKPPARPKADSAPAATPRAPRRAPGLPSVPPERRRPLALAGGAVAIVAVVLIAIAVFGGESSSDSGGGGSSSGGGGSAAEATGAGGGLTQAILEPVGGGEASGKALFGRIGKEEIVLQVTANGLAPANGDNSYTVWLYRSPQVALRVGSVKVNKSGRLGARFPIPTELLAYVASGAFKQIKISQTSDAAYEAEVKTAKQQKALPPYSGKTALEGKITGPIVRAGAGKGG